MEKENGGKTTVKQLVESMAKFSSSFSPSFSPDGTRFAFVSDLNGTPQVWISSIEDKKPQQVTDLDGQVRRVMWSPTGEWLAIAMAPGGGMNVQVYVVKPDGTELKRLTDGGRETNDMGVWAKDGRSIVMSSNRSNPNRMEPFVADIETGEMRQILSMEGRGYIRDTSPDGKYALLYRILFRGDDDLFLVDMDKGKMTLLTPHDPPGNFERGKFSPDGKNIYLISNKDREFIGFSKIELHDDGTPGPIIDLLEREDAELENFSLSTDGKTAALRWNVKGGCSEIEWVDLETLEREPGPKLPGEIVSSISLSRKGLYLAISMSGSRHPTDIWLIDKEANKVSQITNAPNPGIELDSLIVPKLVTFPAHDGVELSGWLYLPKNFKKPGPLILNFHGGPQYQDRPRFNSTYQSLLLRGIAVLAPNIRGSTGFGKIYSSLDMAELRFDAIKDVRSCVNYAVNSGIADAKKVGIMGPSYGGYLVMAGLTEYPDLFAAGATLYGMVNFESFFKNTEPWMAASSKKIYGDPDTQKDLLKALSPIHKIDRVRAPTLVLHGANDTNVPVVEAEQIVDTLKERNVPVEYILFPDEGHGFKKEKNRITATLAIVQWFTEHLTGEDI